MGKRLLRGMALVAILTLAGMFLPRGVTYASPDSEITVNAEFSSNCQGGTTWYAGVISSGQWNTDSFRSGIDFDTTDIPDTAIITKVELRIDIVDEGATDMNNDVAKMTSKARTYYDANNYSGLMADADGNEYLSNSYAFYGKGTHTVELLDAAKQDLQAQLGDNWFSVGWTGTTEANNKYRDGGDYKDTPPPQIIVTYTLPPKVGTQIGPAYPITINPSSITPQEEWTTITVPVQDSDTLADVDEVMVKLFYDSAGSDPDQSGFSANVQTCAVLTWTRGGSPEWDIAPASTTWAINSPGCSKPSDSGTQDNWVFSFKVGKVATHSPSTDDWDIYAKATDSGSGTGEDYLRDKEMDWYGEITVNTASVDWGSVLLGTGFTDDITNRVTASVTYICNGNFNKQIKATSPWGSSPTVTLNPSGTPGADEFSLKADDDLTLSGAVLVSTSYTTFGTGTQTGEAGVDENSNGIWLKMGSSGIQGGVSYDGTIYCAITQS